MNLDILFKVDTDKTGIEFLGFEPKSSIRSVTIFKVTTDIFSVRTRFLK